MSDNTLARVTLKAADALLVVSAIALLMMTFIVGWQVYGRYVLGSSPSWAEQAALTLMIWFIFLGGAAGVRDGFHIRIIAVENMVSQSKRKKMRVLSNIIVGLMGLAMLWWGGELVVRTWSHVIPSLGIPRGMAYLAIPIAGLLIALFSLERILHDPAEKQIVADIQAADLDIADLHNAAAQTTNPPNNGGDV